MIPNASILIFGGAEFAMKVLVTGATCGLGRNAVEYLRRQGIEVIATGNNPAMGALSTK